MEMEALGWLFTAIFIPVAAPNFAQMALNFISANRTHWLVPVKDGQLCWVGVAFAAGGLFELETAAAVLVYKGVVMTGLVISLFLSGMLAAAGSAAPVAPPGPGPINWNQYRLFIGSAVITALSAGCLCAVHFGPDIAKVWHG